MAAKLAILGDRLRGPSGDLGSVSEIDLPRTQLEFCIELLLLWLDVLRRPLPLGIWRMQGSLGYVLVSHSSICLVETSLNKKPDHLTRRADI